MAGIPERLQRFRKFVAANDIGLALTASEGFRRSGRGIVLIDVWTTNNLDRNVGNYRAGYMTQAARAQLNADGGTGNDPTLDRHVAEYDPHREMVVVAVYDDGGHFDFGRFSMPALSTGADVDVTLN